MRPKWVMRFTSIIESPLVKKSIIHLLLTAPAIRIVFHFSGWRASDENDKCLSQKCEPLSHPSPRQVVYWEDDTKPDTIGKVRITGNYTLVNITGLKANTAFYLSVAAFNTAGPGPQSAPINCTTKKPRESISTSSFLRCSTHES